MTLPDEPARWLQRVGLPLDDAERMKIAAVVREPGSSRSIEIVAVGSWHEALRHLTAEDRDNRRWDADEEERERLWDVLTDLFMESELLGRIDAAREEWRTIAREAAIAAAQRLQIADPRFIDEATAAAQLALHRSALATLAGTGSEHPFQRTLRVFQFGRWPLSFAAETLILF